MSDKPENNEYVLSIIEEWLEYPESDDEILSVAQWAMEMIAHLKAARKGDCDGDGEVGLSDLVTVARNWNKTVR